MKYTLTVDDEKTNPGFCLHLGWGVGNFFDPNVSKAGEFFHTNLRCTNPSAFSTSVGDISNGLTDIGSYGRTDDFQMFKDEPNQ